MNNLRCPQCGLSHIKRNGYTHYGKQNYRCKDCDRQFVEDSQRIGLASVGALPEVITYLNRIEISLLLPARADVRNQVRT